MADILRPRRYYLLKRRFFTDVDFQPPLAGAYRHKQEAEPGTDLPADFPALSALAQLGYTTVEDLDGANTDELRDHGLSAKAAQDVIDALAKLL